MEGNVEAVYVIYICVVIVESMEGSVEAVSVTGSGNLATDSVSSLVDVDLLPDTESVAKALIEFMVTR